MAPRVEASAPAPGAATSAAANSDAGAPAPNPPAAGTPLPETNNNETKQPPQKKPKLTQAEKAANMTPLEKGKDLANRVLAKKTATEKYITMLKCLTFGAGLVTHLGNYVNLWQRLACIN